MLAYATEWSIVFIAVHVGVVAVLGGLLYRHAQGAARYGGAGLALWLAVTIGIASSGITADMTAVLSPLGVILTIVMMLGLALLVYWRPLMQAVQAIPLQWLMLVQVYRVLGVMFLVGWLAGEIPAALGPITAGYDVFIGLTAPLVAWLYVKQGAVRLARWWNVAGILDFAYAITVGVLAAPHALQVLTLTPDTAALGLLPLALITLWAVPLSVFLHVACLLRLSGVTSSDVATHGLAA